MPSAFDRVFNIRRVALALCLPLGIRFGFAYRPAQIGARRHGMAAPVIPLLLHQVG